MQKHSRYYSILILKEKQCIVASRGHKFSGWVEMNASRSKIICAICFKNYVIFFNILATCLFSKMKMIFMKENRNYSRKVVNTQKAHKFFWDSLYLNSHIHCKKSNRINMLLYKHHIWMIKIAKLDGKWRSVCFTMKLKALYLNIPGSSRL